VHGLQIVSLYFRPEEDLLLFPLLLFDFFFELSQPPPFQVNVSQGPHMITFDFLKLFLSSPDPCLLPLSLRAHLSLLVQSSQPLGVPAQPSQPAFAAPTPPAPSALAAADLPSADATPAAGGAPEASDDGLPATDTSGGLPRSDRP
jgi:hypothetical protein